jgi:hypothetical protein
MADNATNTGIDQKQQGIKTLVKLYYDLKNSENELYELAEKIKGNMSKVDSFVGEQMIEWQKHDAAFAENLIVAIEQQGITLSELEKDELRRGMKSLPKFKKDLSNGGTQLPPSSSKYVVKTYATLLAALARNLQNYDTAAIAAIAEKIKTIGTENAASTQIKQMQAEVYKNMVVTAKELHSSVATYKGLSTEQKAALEKVRELITPVKRTEEIKPFVPTLEIRND